MDQIVGKLKALLLSEGNCTLFFMIALSVNHLSQYYLNTYLKPLFLVSYLWMLCVYLYHTFVTRKYLNGNLFRLAHVFLIINVIFTFIWPQNRRFSVMQDFAQLILYMFIAFGAFYHHEGKDDRSRLDRMLQLFVAVTFIFSLASIIAIHFNSSWISIQPKYSAKRPRGFYYETNEGGLNAFASTYLGLYFFWKNRDHFGKRPVPVFIMLMLNRFGNFLFSPFYIYWRSFYKTFPFYLFLLVPLYLGVIEVIHIFKMADRKKMFILTFVGYGLTVILFGYSALMGINDTGFISALSEAMPLERLASMPMEILIHALAYLGVSTALLVQTIKTKQE